MKDMEAKVKTDEMAERCLKMTLEAIRNYSRDILNTLHSMQDTHDYSELCNDPTYNSLSDLRFRLIRAYVSAARTAKVRLQEPVSELVFSDLLEPSRVSHFREFCAILKEVPGFKLHPSGLAIESMGDLSGYSQEFQSTVYNLLKKDYLVKNV